jgi:hypothetical protein
VGISAPAIPGNLDFGLLLSIIAAVCHVLNNLLATIFDFSFVTNNSYRKTPRSLPQL